MKRVGVLGDRNYGSNLALGQAADRLGATLAESHLEVVLEGVKDGLMGIASNSVLGHGGKVRGVIDLFLLTLDAGPLNVTSSKFVDSTHLRTVTMAVRASF